MPTLFQTDTINNYETDSVSHSRLYSLFSHAIGVVENNSRISHTPIAAIDYMRAD